MSLPGTSSTYPIAYAEHPTFLDKNRGEGEGKEGVVSSNSDVCKKNSLKESDEHLEKLRRKGICDENGRENQQCGDQNQNEERHISHFTLDKQHADDQKTIERLNHKLQKPLEVISRVPYKSSQTTFSLNFNLNELQSSLVEQELLERMEVVGSAAVRSSRDSLKKAFKIALSDYFDEKELEALWQSGTVQQKIMRKPNDIDSQWHIKSASDTQSTSTEVLDFLGSFFEKMGENTDSNLLQHFFYSKKNNSHAKNPNKKEIAQSAVRDFALEGYTEVFEKENCFCIVGMQPKKGRSHDLTIIAKQLNKCFFSRDCLRILKSWELNEKDWKFLIDCQPFSIRQYFIDLLTSNLSIYNMKTVTEQHWVRYLYYQTTEGARFLEEGIEEQLVAKVFENKEYYVRTRRLKKIESDEVSDVQYVFHLISGYLRNHFALSKTEVDGERALIFVFHACQSLIKYACFSEEHIFELFTLLDKQGFLKINSENLNEAVFIKAGLLEQRLSFKEIQQHLKLRTELFNLGSLTRHDAKKVIDIPLSLTHATAILRLAIETEESAFKIIERENGSFLNSFYTEILSEEKEAALETFSLVSKEWLESSYPLLNSLSLILHLRNISADKMVFYTLFDSLQKVMESNLDIKVKNILLKRFLEALKKEGIQLEDQGISLESFFNDKQVLARSLLALRLHCIKHQSEMYFKSPGMYLKDESILTIHLIYSRLFENAVKIHETLCEATGISLFKALLSIYPSSALAHWKKLLETCPISLEKKFIFFIFCQGMAYSDLKKKGPLDFNSLYDKTDGCISYNFQFPQEHYLEEMGHLFLQMFQNMPLQLDDSFFYKTRASFSKVTLHLIVCLYIHDKKKLAEAILEEVLEFSYKKESYMEDLEAFFSHRIQWLVTQQKEEAFLVFQTAMKKGLLNQESSNFLRLLLSQLLLAKKVPSNAVLKFMQPLEKTGLSQTLEEELYNYLYDSLEQNKVDSAFMNLFHMYLNACCSTQKEKVFKLLNYLLKQQEALLEHSETLCSFLLKKEVKSFWQNFDFFFALKTFSEHISSKTHSKGSFFLSFIQEFILFACSSQNRAFIIEGGKLLTDLLKQPVVCLPSSFLQPFIKEKEYVLLENLSIEDSATLYDLMTLLNQKDIKMTKNTLHSVHLIQWKLGLDEPLTDKIANEIHHLLSCQSPESMAKIESFFPFLYQFTLDCLKLKKMKAALHALKLCLVFSDKENEMCEVLLKLIEEDAETVISLLLENSDLKLSQKQMEMIAIKALKKPIKQEKILLGKRIDLFIKLNQGNENCLSGLLQNLSQTYLDALFKEKSKDWEKVISLFHIYLPENGYQWLKLFEGLYASNHKNSFKQQKEQACDLLVKAYEHKIYTTKEGQKSIAAWMMCWTLFLEYLKLYKPVSLLPFLNKEDFIETVYASSSEDRRKAYQTILTGCLSGSFSVEPDFLMKAIIIRNSLFEASEPYFFNQLFDIDLCLVKTLSKLSTHTYADHFYSAIFLCVKTLLPFENFNKKGNQFLVPLEHLYQSRELSPALKKEALGLLVQIYQICKLPFPITEELFFLLLDMKLPNFALNALFDLLKKDEFKDLEKSILLKVCEMQKEEIARLNINSLKQIFRRALIKYGKTTSKADHFHAVLLEKYLNIEFEIEDQTYTLLEVDQKVANYKKYVFPILEDSDLAMRCLTQVIYFLIDDLHERKKIKGVRKEFFLRNFNLIRTVAFLDKNNSLYLQINSSEAATYYYYHLIQEFNRLNIDNYYHLWGIYDVLIAILKNLMASKKQIGGTCLGSEFLNEIHTLCPPISMAAEGSLSENMQLLFRLSKSRKESMLEMLTKKLHYSFSHKEEISLEVQLCYFDSFHSIRTHLSSSKKIEICLKVIDRYLDFNETYFNESIYSLYRAIKILDWIQVDLLIDLSTLTQVYEKLVKATSLFASENLIEHLGSEAENSNFHTIIFEIFRKLLEQSRGSLSLEAIESFKKIFYFQFNTSIQLATVLTQKFLRKKAFSKLKTKIEVPQISALECFEDLVDLKQTNNIVTPIVLAMNMLFMALKKDIFLDSDFCVKSLDHLLNVIKKTSTIRNTPLSFYFTDLLLNFLFTYTLTNSHKKNYDEVKKVFIEWFKVVKTHEFLSEGFKYKNEHALRVLYQTACKGLLDEEDKDIHDLLVNLTHEIKTNQTDIHLLLVLDILQPTFHQSIINFPSSQNEEPLNPLLTEFQALFFDSEDITNRELNALDKFEAWFLSSTNVQELCLNLETFANYLEKLKIISIYKNNAINKKLSRYVLELIQQILDSFKSYENVDVQKKLCEIERYRLSWL